MLTASGSELILLASSLAIGISENLSVNEVSTLSDFFNALSDNLAIIATQRSINESE